MNPQSARNHLIIVTGPTAIGKTSIAIKLAEHLKTEIISADSRQFYKEMHIGTAVPSSEELQKIKHHFIHFLSIHDYYNVSRFEQEALKILSNIFISHSCAIAVGGSGMYLDTLCYGIDDLPDPDENLRNRIKNEYKELGLDHLRKKLKELDPAYYKIADLSNPNRLMRAIEVSIQTGKTYSSFRKNMRSKRGFKIIKIGLNRARSELFEIINNRVDSMIEKGLKHEVEKLFEFRNLNALNTVGYKELFSYFDGHYSLDQAVEKIKTNTRRYAKRQLTWFNRDEDITWFHPDNVSGIIQFIEGKLLHSNKEG